MIIVLRESKTGKLVGKDIIDVDLDISIEERDDKFVVKASKDYEVPELFDTEPEAENKLLEISATRNKIEASIWSYA